MVERASEESPTKVLILVLMEYGLRASHLLVVLLAASLNPCFNGIWSASSHRIMRCNKIDWVLILVLMEYGLRAFGSPLGRQTAVRS